MIMLSRYSLLLITVAICSAVSAHMELSDEPPGVMTCQYYNAGTRMAWEHQGGDWIDADGLAQGDRAYSRRTISRSRDRAVLEWDLTELARKWEQGAEPGGGIYLRQLADRGASVKFQSRESDDESVRPKMLIEWDSGGSTVLAPSADTEMTCTSMSGKGTKKNFEVGNNRSAILVFPFDAKPAARVRSARLILVSDKQYGPASDIGVFRLHAPFVRPAEVQQGLAASYPLDQGIELHPAVVFATGFESTRWMDEWSKVGESSAARPVARDNANRFKPISGDALKVTIGKGKKMGLNALFRFKDKTGSEPEAMYFRYYLRLGDDWTPAVAGKMPGFAGTYGRAGWGGRQSDGTNGWSTRGRYETSKALGDGEYSLGSYVYHAALTKGYGDGWGWNLGPTGKVVRNRWYSVEQYLKLNDPGMDNGVLKAWIDGVLVFDRRGIRFRDTSALRIETLWMNVYHGGTAKAPRDISLYIDNLVIASEYIGPAGNVPPAH